MKKSYLALFLFLTNFFAGILFMNEGLFYHDSVILAQSVENTYSTGVLHPAVRGRYGAVIVNYIIGLPAHILGHNSDFAVRLSSVLFQALSIAALFLFLSMLFINPNIAFFASLLFSFTPLYFSPNTYGKEHGMSIFFLLISFVVLYRSLKKQSLALTILSGIIFVFSITIRESMLGAIPLFFLLFFDPRLALKNKIRLLLPAVFSVIVCISLVMSLYLGKEIHNALLMRTYAATRFLGLFSIASYSALLKWISPYLLVLLGIFFVIGAFKIIKDKQWFLAAFFFLWLVIFLYLANTSSYCPRFFDMSAIAFYVFVSYALANLCDKDKIFAFSFLIYFVLSMIIFMAPMLLFRRVYNGPKQFALYVHKNTENNAIIIAMDDAPFIEYYGKRTAITHPIDNPAKIAAFFKSIDADLRKGVPAYSTSNAFSYDFDGVFREGLFKDFNVTLVGEKLTEDYHRTEHRFCLYYGKLFRISLKN